jgi:RNA polymerase sigma-70 factor (ECF subfamily)
MPDPDRTVTRLLASAREGDPHASAELLQLLYGELHRLAAAYMRRERPGHTLQATALVNEVYLRLSGGEHEYQNRAHFLAFAANSMRQVLLDQARRRRAHKRGAGARQVDLDSGILVSAESVEDTLAIDEALQRLRAIDPRQERIVELRFFGGLSVEETAAVLGVAPITIKREWRSAKAWLYRELGSAAGREGGA